MQTDLKEFDKVSWFPEWITQLTREGKVVDPVMRVLEALPPNDQIEIKRELELAIHRKTLNMSDEQRASLQQAVKPDENQEFYEVQLTKWRHERNGNHLARRQKMIYDSPIRARDELFSWFNRQGLNRNNVCRPITFQECIDLVVKKLRYLRTYTPRSKQLVDFWELRVNMCNQDVNQPLGVSVK